MGERGFGSEDVELLLVMCWWFHPSYFFFPLSPFSGWPIVTLCPYFVGGRGPSFHD